MQLQLVDPLGDGGIGPWQEAGADAIGDVAEPEIEARRLDLALDKVIGGQDEAGLRHLRDHAVGQNSVGFIFQRERHDAVPRRSLEMAQNQPLSGHQAPKYRLLRVIR